MRAVDLIAKKRNGSSLTQEEIRFLLQGFTQNSVPDYQMSAFAMAVYFNGMSKEELAFFTDTMLKSGESLDCSDIGKPCIDKHSTGGVGDKISLPLAPAVAACGIAVPMIAGRGLGHTGGTIDKLESIPGFQTQLSSEQFKKQLRQLGCAIIGQTQNIAPTDKKLYALRDVTGTVESIPLIAASIMSKKLAEGLDGLVLDVKTGSGAFMKDLAKAQELAQTMVNIGKQMGKKTSAYLTDMDQPLGKMVGNALEIEETLDVLEGKGPPDVVELVECLGAEMLFLGEQVSSLEEGKKNIQRVLQNGQAMEIFSRMVEAQGGDPRIIFHRTVLPQAPYKIEVLAVQSGYISAMNNYEIGLCLGYLGGARQQLTDSIDPAVGLAVHVKIGDAIHQGTPLFTIYTRKAKEEELEKKLVKLVSTSPLPVLKPLLIKEIIR